MGFGSFISSNISGAAGSLGNFNKNLTAAQNQLSKVNFGGFNKDLRGAISGISGLPGNVQGITDNFTRKLESIQRAGMQDFEMGLLGKIPLVKDFESMSNAIKVLPGGLAGGIGENVINSAVAKVAGGSIGGLLNSATSLFSGDRGGAFFGLASIGSGGRTDRSNTAIATDANGRLKNPLRSYAAYNYRITLACITSAEVNTPESGFRSRGLSNVICQTGGGALTERVTTFGEVNYNTTGEYYLEDLEMDALIAPNSKTGVAMGTNIAFTVLEPYSMGQFLEAMQVAAVQANHANYIEAPYILRIQFLGFDENSAPMPNKQEQNVTTKYVPIKLTNVEFQVDGQGSRYSVEAIPYNEQALVDEIAQVPTDVSISGNAVDEYLQRGERSLTNVLNARNETREDANVSPQEDRYIIMFPDDKQGATSAVEAAGGANVYETLKNFSETHVNEIGRAILTNDTNEGGTRPMGSHVDAMYDDGPIRYMNRQAVAQQDLERTGQYVQGTNIVGIIEDVIISSEYGKSLAETPAENGFKTWFKVETMVFDTENIASELTNGTKAKVYVYSVVPFLADEAKFMGPGRTPSSTEELKANAVKEYNYFYTGKNEDVLDFAIEFKGAFYQNLYADLGQFNLPIRSGAGSEVVANTPPPGTVVAPPGIGPAGGGGLAEPKAPVRNSDGKSPVPNGIATTASSGTKRAIAEAFHNTLINGDTDMVQAEMEIWGDPFYIPTSGMGNYNAPASGVKRNTNADGGMDYQNEEVLIVVNFRTPTDYAEGGLMQFSTIVKPFSGLFQVNEVTNTFSKGQFKTNLKMIRRRGQNDEATGQSEAITEGATNNMDPRAADRMAAGQYAGPGGPVGNQQNRTLTNANSPTTSGGTGPGATNSTAPAGSPAGSGGQLATITTSKKGKSTQVAASLAPQFQAMIDELENVYGYEIYSIGGYNYRYIGKTSTLSWHSGGIAIDINPRENPFGPNYITDMPAGGTGSEMVALANKYGMGWGGAWTGKSKDAMHFSAASNEGGSLQGLRRGVIPSGGATSLPATETPQARTGGAQ